MIARLHSLSNCMSLSKCIFIILHMFPWLKELQLLYFAILHQNITALLECILIPPDSQTITYDGSPTANLPPTIKRRTCTESTSRRQKTRTASRYFHLPDLPFPSKHHRPHRRFLKNLPPRIHTVLCPLAHRCPLPARMLPSHPSR